MTNTNAKPLVEIIETRRQSHNRHARNNYKASFFLYLVAIIASFIATLSVASKFFSTEILAVITAIPAGVILLNSVLRLEQKSRWHYKYFHELDKLWHQLSYEHASESDVSKKVASLGSSMQKEYPAFGMASLRKELK